MTFFEIDPAMERIARDPKSVPLSGAVPAGRARRHRRWPAGPAQTADEAFDLLILDAFSSDAIPVHLLTREALALYMRKLAPGGIALLHISNRYLELEPVVANLVDDAGLDALIQEHDPDDDDESPAGGSASTWVAVAREPNDLDMLTSDSRWRELEPDPAVGVWTDDYSNIFRILIWGRLFHLD